MPRPAVTAAAFASSGTHQQPALHRFSSTLTKYSPPNCLQFSSYPSLPALQAPPVCDRRPRQLLRFSALPARRGAPANILPTLSALLFLLK
ncbi:hypothetical protein PMIN02_006725 [Paraphaeosphaeria minitans]